MVASLSAFCAEAIETCQETTAVQAERAMTTICDVVVDLCEMDGAAGGDIEECTLCVMIESDGPFLPCDTFRP